MPPLASTAYQITPWANDSQHVAGVLGRTVYAMAGPVDQAPRLMKCPAMDTPGVTVGTEDVDVAEL
jgi:hypothetical protein